jgi:hypothetical protein
MRASLAQRWSGGYGHWGILDIRIQLESFWQAGTQPFEFLTGGGSVGALMRSRDWSTSPLGPPAGWPPSLRTVVGLLLQSRFPMFVAWGKELGFLL